MLNYLSSVAMISTPLWDRNLLLKCHRAGNKRPLLANLHEQMSIFFSAVEELEKGKQ